MTAAWVRQAWPGRTPCLDGCRLAVLGGVGQILLLPSSRALGSWNWVPWAVLCPVLQLAMVWGRACLWGHAGSRVQTGLGPALFQRGPHPQAVTLWLVQS